MFFPRELSKLQKLVNPDLKADHFFTEEELQAFGSSLPLISESLFIPKHNRKVKTLRLKKFFSPDFNLEKFTENILSIMKKSVDLRIGASFLVHSGPAAEDIKYYFAIAQRPINADLTSIEDEKSADNLLSFLSNKNQSDILNIAYDHVNQESVFEKSDFRPRCLVLATFWISRYD